VAHSLVEMMITDGSNPQARNAGRLTPYQLIDPANAELRAHYRRVEEQVRLAHEQEKMQSHGGFVNPENVTPTTTATQEGGGDGDDDDDDDAEFSGSDDEERAEWERRRREKRGKR
jgi:hypothetical protein